MVYAPTHTLGELLQPLARRYGMNLADIASIWEIDEEEARWLLLRPVSELDVETLSRVVIQTGLKPRNQPLWNNFILFVARESRIEVDERSGFHQNRVRDPFLIELFLALFRCLTTATQKKLVWTLVWANTPHPPWLAEMPEFLEQQRGWAEEVYWRWNELDFAELGTKYLPAEVNARSALLAAGCGIQKLNHLQTSPSYLIFRSLFITLEAWIAPPDDRRQILHRVIQDPAPGKISPTVPPDTFWRALLAPLWEANPGNISATERQSAQAICSLLDLLGRFPYPPVRLPSAKELVEMGTDLGRSSQ